jgi:hypothetical protein
MIDRHIALGSLTDDKPLTSTRRRRTGSRRIGVGACLLLPLVVGLIAAADDAPPASPAPPVELQMGMNMAQLNYWGRDWAFVDVLQHANWRQKPRGWKEGRLFLNSHGRYPGGTYTCTYDGVGDVRFERDATAIRFAPGRIDVAVGPREGIHVSVRSDPNNPIRNLQLIMPGFANADSPFHPLFVERLKPFGVIRFMNWQKTNSTREVQWSDRTLPHAEISVETNPIALEYMIELTNELGADPWFCMPHQADDEYVRNFAQLVKSSLHEKATIYVEYSSELWNSRFIQSRWLIKQAEVDDRKGEHNHLFIAEWARQAQRDFALWAEVFADNPQRLVRVISGQENNTWIIGRLMEEMDGQFDAISTTAYFGRRAATKLGTKATPQQLIVEALRDLHENRQPNRIKHGQMARQQGVRYIAYEGGQHLMPGSGVSLDIVIAAQQLPEMYDAYLENLRLFREAGGSLFVAFNYIRAPTESGAWGHLVYQDQPIDQAPKYKAIVDYAQMHAPSQKSETNSSP